MKPANILNIVATNQGLRPLTMDTPAARPLSAPQVMDFMTEGYIIVDVRDSAVFGSGHIPGAINVQLSSSEFEQRVGWMTPDDTPIILVMQDDDDAQEAIVKMAYVALDSAVTGYLEGGMEAWRQAGNRMATIPQMDVHTLRKRLIAGDFQVLDVRDQDEWDEGHIEGAVFMPYTSMVPQLDYPAKVTELPLLTEQTIAVTCAGGMRSSTATSILMRAGFNNLYNITGGMEAWKDAGFKMINAQGMVCPVDVL